jgi:hypothetical protein
VNSSTSAGAPGIRAITPRAVITIAQPPHSQQLPVHPDAHSTTVPHKHAHLAAPGRSPSTSAISSTRRTARLFAARRRQDVRKTDLNHKDTKDTKNERG